MEKQKFKETSDLITGFLHNFHKQWIVELHKMDSENFKVDEANETSYQMLDILTRKLEELHKEEVNTTEFNIFSEVGVETNKEE